MPLPTVTRLSTTPIKGFALTHPDEVQLDVQGAVGDRDFFVTDAAGALLSITRTGVFASWSAQFDPATRVLTLTSADGQVVSHPVLEGERVGVDFWGSREVVGHVVAGPWSDILSTIAGQPVTLIRAETEGGGFDEHAVTLVAEESVAELGRAAAAPAVDPRRFRMLIDFSGVEPYTEETWNQQTMRVGGAVLRVRGPVPRCNATTRNPDTGARDLKTLKILAQVRGMTPNDYGEDLNLGVYADVVEPGVVRVGDELTLTDSGSAAV